MIEAALIRAAAKRKKATVAKAAVLIRSNAPLLYQGPRDPHGLWSAGDAFRHRVGVRVGMIRVMRTRPRFDNWFADISIDFLPTMIEAEDLGDFLAVAGEQIGIGDWRLRCGRFTVAASGGGRADPLDCGGLADQPILRVEMAQAAARDEGADARAGWAGTSSARWRASAPTDCGRALPRVRSPPAT